LRVLAFGDSAVPPQDVNIARVTARAALGKEPGDVRQPLLEEGLAAGRPKGMTARAFTYALFDVGALHCKARPLCNGCPLAPMCASRDRLAGAPPPRARRQPAYRGSTRELRGAVLRTMLADPRPASIAELQSRAGPPAEGRPSSDIAHVLDTLVHEGLVSPTPRMVRIN
jgi:A/G-specific adenine glycosylase